MPTSVVLRAGAESVQWPIRSFVAAGTACVTMLARRSQVRRWFARPRQFRRRAGVDIAARQEGAWKPDRLARSAPGQNGHKEAKHDAPGPAEPRRSRVASFGLS